MLYMQFPAGTTEPEIVATFERAERALLAEGGGGAKEVFVFLDECNACPHVGLITEAISMKSVHGRALSDGVKILAALNPYRRRPERAQTPGLVFKLGDQTTPDPMASLVYRVHPIPATLQDLIFDFGALPPEREKQYILSMVERTPALQRAVGAAQPKLHTQLAAIITDFVAASQEYVRTVEGDRSSCSLRDVKRTMHLVAWFLEVAMKKHTDKHTGKEPAAGEGQGGGGASKEEQQASKAAQDGTRRHKDRMKSMAPLVTAVVLSLAHVYFYRLSTSTARHAYWATLREVVRWDERAMKGTPFLNLGEAGVLEQIVQQQQKRFCRRMVLEDGIAMNEALMENLFVCIVCVLNRIPVFVVGKPGSSKTLTMQVRLHIAYKALNHKDTLHINHQIKRTLCI